MNHDLDQYVVRIDQNKFPLLRALVQGGQLQQVLTSVPGWPRAAVYQPLPQVTAGGDNLLQLGLIQLTAQLYALPSAAYEALLRSSSEYWQPAGLAELRTLFSTPGVDASTFRTALKATLARPLVQDHTPHLAAKDHGCHADWRPDGTLLFEQGGTWYLVLAFELRSLVPWAQERRVFGIDLNDDPSLCIVDAARTVQMIGGPHTLLETLRREHVAGVTGAQLSPDEIRLVSTLGYAAGREPLEAALRGLLGQARAVGVEQLDLRGLQARFVARSRERATLDCVMAWLPQALYRAGIKLYRVPAANTTRACHRHPTQIGTVRGRMFHCPRCGEAQHRDVNAALNVLTRTLHIRHLEALK
ncbi:zinc ribbon domain-containing protein [Deinococcus aquaticus]|uniref:zinc ribbon domain-containing protein n=1 Tax=Deinococcus aquaticus TaxID=328692 RepID=UPI003F472CA8